MKMKRVLAALLTASLAAGMMAGCKDDQDTSSKEESSASASSSTSSTASAEEKEPERKYPLNEEGLPDLDGIELSMWVRPDGTRPKFNWQTDMKNNIKYNELLEACNFNMNFISCPLGQEQEAFSILISSREWPDFINLFSEYYPGKYIAGLNDGVVLDTEPYLETYAPNFMSMIEKDSLFKKLVYNDDGKIIGFGGQYDDGGANLPDYWQKLTCHIGPMIRKDYLEKTGLDIPHTISEWYEMLKAFKENGVKIPYAWYSSGRPDLTGYVGTFSGAYDVYYNFMVKQDGTVTYGPAEPNFKEFLTEMSKWYAEGLINPDYPTHGFGADIMPLMLSDQVGSVTCHAFDYWYSYLQPYVEGENHPERDFIDVPFPTLTEGSVENRFRETTGGSIYLGSTVATTQTKYPEACVALMDVAYDPQNFIRFGKGVEGKIYQINEDGTETNLFGNLNEEERTIYGGFLPFGYCVPHTVKEVPLHKRWGECCVTWKNSGTSDGRLPTSLTLTADEQDIVSKYLTSFDAYAQEWMMKFMTGVEPLSKFDEYVEGLKKLHMDDLVSIYQAAYDRFQHRGE